MAPVAAGTNGIRAVAGWVDCQATWPPGRMPIGSRQAWDPHGGGGWPPPTMPMRLVRIREAGVGTRDRTALGLVGVEQRVTALDSVDVRDN